ncbi:MAG: polyhydroxyalkanoate synthesis regulator [Candidatus Omnitrophota bacterium]
MDILKEFVDLGLGLLTMTQEQVEKTVQQLVKKRKIGEKESKAFLRSLVKKGKAESQHLKKEVSKITKEVVSGLNLATKQDLKRLEKEIAKLKKRKS